MHRLVVKPLPAARGRWGRRMIQHAQRVLAVISGYPDKLDQDLPPLATIAAPLISLPDRILKLSPCCHAQLPCHLRHRPAAGSLRGSSLREDLPALATIAAPL